MGLLPGPDLKLAGLLGARDVDPQGADPPQALVAMAPIDDLKDLVVLLEPLLHEGQHQAVLLLEIVEEGACVASMRDRRARQLHRAIRPAHVSVPIACDAVKV